MSKRIVGSTILIMAILVLAVSSFAAGGSAVKAATSAPCKVTYSLSSQWAGGFSANISIANTGTAAINGWTLAFTFPGDQKITQGWSATYTQSGANVTAQNASWDGTIAPNGSVSIGFNGSWTSNNTSPSAFTLNGTACNAQPPTVSLSASGTTFQAPANIVLTATAAAASGSTITRVEFYNGSMLIGTATSSPYTFSWNNVAAGTYSLTSIAYASNGTSATSAAITVTVVGGTATTTPTTTPTTATTTPITQTATATATSTPTTPTILASTASMNVQTGSTAQVGFDLSQQPAGSVTVTVACAGCPAGVTVSQGATLMFTAQNWNQIQNVTVSASTSATVGATGTLTASATGYTGASVGVVVRGTGTYISEFMTMYNKIKDPANGYFSPLGIPYHTPETLIVEAPDYGHETTSETYSYWIWLEATYGKETKNWQPFNNAWTNMETYMIPSHADQPTNAGYNASSPAQYAPESDSISNYPVQLDSTIAVGSDPLSSELQSTYGTPDIYGMTWLLDTDNWYGYGHCGDGTTKPSFMNSYQRGPTESVWKTIPQPDCDTFKWGSSTGTSGFLSLFTKNSGGGAYAQQWKYTDAPDADARTVQAAFWAFTWATQQGVESQIAATIAKAAKMGDYLRYSTYDKYFKVQGCGSPTCPAGSGKNSSDYLLNWYYAWGGAVPSAGSWAWRIGSGYVHEGYQNPLAAWAMSSVPALEPLSPTAPADWKTSLSRQLQFYQWLQSSQGAIAGGAANSWDGHYGTPPAGDPTFYGMGYDWQPEYHDPPSNQWFGFQAWPMERVAEYYYETGDTTAQSILSKWVAWAESFTTFNSDGTFTIPSTLNWSGQPANSVNATTAPVTNTNLSVTVAGVGTDLGVAAAYAKTLAFYAAKANDSKAQSVAKQLLDDTWNHYQDSMGVSAAETRTDYSQFNGPVFVPSGWTGTMANGGTLNQSSTFISIRPPYQKDPAWSKVQTYLNGGAAPTFNYHRFWAESDVAIALDDFGMLFPSASPA